jgi:phosphatidylserine decarboxylase
MNSKQPTSKRSFYWHFLNQLPQNLISRVAGHLAALQLPKPIMLWVIKRFARKFNINLGEISRPLEDFESLQAFFIRELKAGVRPVDQTPTNFVSPCDGAYGQSGVVEKGLLMQVKGKSFRLAELLSDDKWSQSLEGATYAVLYLSPRDYHRFHAPCDMRIVEAAYVPGRLWPVNLWAVANVDEVFCVNERVVMKADLPSQNTEPFAIIAVGATMVGKVKVTFDEVLTSNIQGGKYQRRSYAPFQATLSKGQELGRFEFGSTLVLVMPKKFGRIDSQEPGTPIRMGQKIGCVNTPTS